MPHWSPSFPSKRKFSTKQLRIGFAAAVRAYLRGREPLSARAVRPLDPLFCAASRPVFVSRDWQGRIAPGQSSVEKRDYPWHCWEPSSNSTSPSTSMISRKLKQHFQRPLTPNPSKLMYIWKFYLRIWCATFSELLAHALQKFITITERVT